MGDELRVTGQCSIDLDEIVWRFGTSGGPGGQHANRVRTRAEASFDVEASASLSDRQRRRLVQKLGSPVVASADDTRSQARNRELALQRLATRLAAALEVEKPRRPTKPTRAANQRRLEAKRRRSEAKRQRSRPRDDM